MKETQFAKYILRFPIDNLLSDNNLDFGIYGAIFSKTQDQAIILPSLPESPGIIKGHNDSIKFTFRHLYNDWKNQFVTSLNIIKEKCPKQVCFVDLDEMIYAIFLASIGEVVFLDSSDGKFNSGLIILPENLHSLSEKQVQITYKLASKFSQCESYEAYLVSDYTQPEKDAVTASLSYVKNQLQESFSLSNNYRK